MSNLTSSSEPAVSKLPKEIDDAGRDAARIALYAAVLGGFASVSAALGILQHISLPLSLYVAVLCTFHLLEYWTTARFNPNAATSESFLLYSNGAAYWVAQASGLLEVHLRRRYPVLAVEALLNTRFVLGLAMILLGQAVRSTAMCQAGVSFSHLIAKHHRQQHVLVTTGIYSWSRHPSYFGFFYFAIGTQVMLGNVFSVCTFTAILWRFFSRRIEEEERYLVKFFGDAYLVYRARVATLIPAIR